MKPPDHPSPASAFWSLLVLCLLPCALARGQDAPDLAEPVMPTMTPARAGSPSVEGATPPTVDATRTSPERDIYQRRMALCVGIERVQGCPRVPTARNDAIAMRVALRDAGYDQVLLLLDDQATRDRILDALLWLRAESRTNDLFVFYFAGYGQTATLDDGRRVGALLAADTNARTNLFEDAITLDLLRDVARGLPARHSLFLLETSFADDRLEAGAPPSAARAGERTVLRPLETTPVAGDFNHRCAQVLLASTAPSGPLSDASHGLFTASLLDAILTEAPAAPVRGITGLALADRFRETAGEPSATRQHSVSGFLNGLGDLAFTPPPGARRPSAIRARSNPDSIETTIRLQREGNAGEAERMLSRLFWRAGESGDPTFATDPGWLRRLCDLSLILEEHDIAIQYARRLLRDFPDKGTQGFAANNLGAAWFGKGQYARALRYYQAARSVLTEVLGEDHPHVLTVIDNIGTLHLAREEGADALACFRKTLAKRAPLGSETTPEASACWRNLGLARQLLRDYPQADSAFRRALTIDTELFGPLHPRVSRLHRDLGILHRERGRYVEAIEQLEQALHIEERTFIGKERSIASLCMDLGITQRMAGHPNEAARLFQRALHIRQDILGRVHRDVADAHNNLGLALAAGEQYRAAIEHYEEALAIYRDCLPPHDPVLALLYSNLGSAYDRLGRYSRALAFYEQALAIERTSSSSNELSIACLYNNIGVTYDNLDKPDNAIEFYNEAIVLRKRILGERHPLIAPLLANLGAAYDTKKDYERAIDTYEKALHLAIDTLGPAHPWLAVLYANLGAACDSRGDPRAAISYYDKVVKHLGAGAEDHDPLLAIVYNNMGVAHAKIGELQLAGYYLERASRIKSRLFGIRYPLLDAQPPTADARRAGILSDREWEHPCAAITYQNLGIWYTLEQRDDPADLFHRSAERIRMRDALEADVTDLSPRAGAQ